MKSVERARHRGLIGRYAKVTSRKAGGATYTPSGLADFVAREIGKAILLPPLSRAIRILDPAVGHGQLLVSLLEQIEPLYREAGIIVCGFETDGSALRTAAATIARRFPSVQLDLQNRDFLHFVLDLSPDGDTRTLFGGEPHPLYDLVIANPPYVRTQIMGAQFAQHICRNFQLSGRADLYYAFILGIAQVLNPRGTVGIIVSNRFMTTKSGEGVRRAISQRYAIRHVWDLGDTKLFDAAVLPAVLLLHGRDAGYTAPPCFSSIYAVETPSESRASDPIEAISHSGVVGIPDGRSFCVQHGKLHTDRHFREPWRVATDASDSWLGIVDSNTWGRFGDIGKIRVGVKTCADSVFIRCDWSYACPLGEPELLRPLVTHHAARRFRGMSPQSPRMILYPHESAEGSKHVVDISRYPLAKAYLERYRDVLAARRYVLDAGREWYEIWVPQDPGAWERPKLVFRDISEKPTFWLDMDQSVVNGDCYWLTVRNLADVDLLWLAAAVANSKFIEVFYDHKFHNKLYAGRRRFMTQYVEQFPLPDPKSVVACELIERAKRIYDLLPSGETALLEAELDETVWRAFGLATEEVRG